jgi:hypothetical protein
MQTKATCVTLVTTVHEPKDELLVFAKSELPVLKSIYGEIMAVCSRETSPHILDLLETEGVLIHTHLEESPGVQGMGKVRLLAIRAGIGTRCSHLHLCDFDRVLHWAKFYAGELRFVVQLIKAYDFLVLGRTARALNTHPKAQLEPETLVNEAFALLSSMQWDICTSSRGLSRAAAEILLEYAREKSCGADAEWPLILQRFPQMGLGYYEVEGLEFETLDRLTTELRKVGDEWHWKAEIENSVEAWSYRVRLASLSIQACIKASQDNYIVIKD